MYDVFSTWHPPQMDNESKSPEWGTRPFDHVSNMDHR
jgi:hypothetical protein